MNNGLKAPLLFGAIILIYPEFRKNQLYLKRVTSSKSNTHTRTTNCKVFDPHGI